MNVIPVLPGGFDAALSAFEGHFALGEARYETAGAWAYPQREWVMAAGASHLSGLGPGRTVLGFRMNPERYLVGPPGSGGIATYLHLLTAGGRIAAAEGVSVARIRLEASAEWPTKALQIWASSATVRDCEVVGLWGDRSILEGEAFGILVNDSPANPIHGDHLVRGCRVEARPGAYVCGIYVGTVGESGKGLVRSLVEDCSVLCPSNPATRAHCAYGLNSQITLRRCRAHGFERPFFSDTGAGVDARIESCLATGCSIGVEFRSSRPEWVRRNVEVIDSTFVCDGGAGAYVAGLVLADDSQGAHPEMAGIRFEGCTFINASGKPGHVGSSNGPNFGPVEFRDCRWYGPWDDGQAKAAGWRFVGNRFQP